MYDICQHCCGSSYIAATRVSFTTPLAMILSRCGSLIDPDKTTAAKTLFPFVEPIPTPEQRMKEALPKRGKQFHFRVWN